MRYRRVRRRSGEVALGRGLCGACVDVDVLGDVVAITADVRQCTQEALVQGRVDRWGVGRRVEQAVVARGTDPPGNTPIASYPGTSTPVEQAVVARGQCRGDGVQRHHVHVPGSRLGGGRGLARQQGVWAGAGGGVRVGLGVVLMRRVERELQLERGGEDVRQGRARGCEAGLQRLIVPLKNAVVDLSAARVSSAP